MKKHSQQGDHPLPKLVGKIYSIRGHRVMLDSDLSALYGVETKRLNEQVRRNIRRFPADFAFQLVDQELTDLRSQFATSSSRHGGRRYLPWAFTEHRVAMLSSVLATDQAIEVNITIIREFIRMRSVLKTSTEIEKRISMLESNVDKRFQSVFAAIRQIIAEVNIPRKKIRGLAHSEGKP